MRVRPAVAVVSALMLLGASPPPPAGGIPAEVISVGAPNYVLCISGYYPLQITVATKRAVAAAADQQRWFTFHYTISVLTGGAPTTTMVDIPAYGSVEDAGQGSVNITQAFCAPITPDVGSYIAASVEVTR